MNEEEFQRKLAALVSEIATINAPADHQRLLEIAKCVQRKRRAELETTVAQLQENIDFVRLSIKYLLFDLEATRRENAQLKKLLEEYGH